MTNDFSFMMIRSLFQQFLFLFFIQEMLNFVKTRACSQAKLSFIFLFYFFGYKNSLEATLDYITFIIQQYAAILLRIYIKWQMPIHIFTTSKRFHKSQFQFFLKYLII